MKVIIWTSAIEHIKTAQNQSLEQREYFEPELSIHWYIINFKSLTKEREVIVENRKT